MNDRRGGPNPYADLSKRTSGGGGGSRTTLLIAGIAIALVAILAVVAIFLTGSEDGGEDAVQEQAPVEVEGSALPPYPEGASFVVPPDQDPAVGETPPTLTGEDFQGEPVSVDPGDGSAKVVVFLAHWCPHCQAEVPVIQGWIDDGNLPDDVEVYAVSTAVTRDRPNYPPSEWLSSEGWTGPILLDDPDSSAASAWALRSFPYMVFVDDEGKVTRRASGEVPADEFAELVEEISG
jgi:cytochrome c biogenesis protein CcmG/thiol:disulfide interchange protein DsbE